MRYSNDELERLNIDSTVQCDNNGVRPYIYKEEKDDQRGHDDDDYEGEWTLRKASAWALDCLSNPYADDVLDILSPLIEVSISNRLLLYRMV